MEQITVILDAKDANLGRLSSVAAKNAISGNNVIVVNCKDAIITGNEKDILEKYRTLQNMGSGGSRKGPRVIKLPHRIVKKSIRGMLPDHRRGFGKQAFKKVMCYDDCPEEFIDKEKINFQRPKHNKYVRINKMIEKL